MNHIPIRLESAKIVIHRRETLVWRPSRPKNGATNTAKAAHTVTYFQGAMRRQRMKCVSSLKLPYQMTRYWPNVRYPQKAVNAKHSLPMSWKCVSVINPPAVSRCEFQARTSTANSIRAHSQPPMKNHQLYSVLWKCGDRPIERSHASTDQPTANI